MMAQLMRKNLIERSPTANRLGGPKAIRRLPDTERLMVSSEIARELGKSYQAGRCVAILLIKSLIKEGDTLLAKGDFNSASQKYDAARLKASRWKCSQLAREAETKLLVADADKEGRIRISSISSWNQGWEVSDAIIKSKCEDLIEFSMHAAREMQFDLANEMISVAQNTSEFYNVQVDEGIIKDQNDLANSVNDAATETKSRINNTQYVRDYQSDGFVYRIPVSWEKGNWMWELVSDETIIGILETKIKKCQITTRTELCKEMVKKNRDLFHEAKKRNLLDKVLPRKKTGKAAIEVTYMDYAENGESYQIPVFEKHKQWVWKLIETETIRKLIEGRLRQGARTRSDIYQTPKGGSLMQEARRRKILDGILPAISR